MNKKIKIIIVFLFFATLAIFSKGILASIAFNMGNIFFEQKNYQIANKHFSNAYTLKPQNTKYKKKYIENLTFLPLDYETQKKLWQYANEYPKTQTSQLAQSHLDKLRNTILQQYENNYLSSCLLNGKVVRWNEKTFPLKVYIQKDTPDEYKIITKTSFKKWEDTFDNFFSFTFTENIEEANILVDFQMKNNADEETLYHVAANTVPEFDNNQILRKMSITLNSNDIYGKSIDTQEIYTTFIHEIGHALGILGHSDNYDDLMYISSKGEFSQADINTIKLLYLTVPEISNTPQQEINTNKRFYPPIITGSEEAIQTEQYQRAVNYLEKAPDLSAGWVELATVYYETKDYTKAINALNHAKKLAQTKEELFFINYNLSSIYTETSEFSKAIECANKALEIKYDKKLKLTQAYALSQNGNNEEAINILQKLFAEEPQDLDIGFLLANIYLSEKKYSETKKVLRKMKQSNPQYSQDPRTKNFGIWNILA